jgi:aryl-alcohol dehydrogenase-like predicted oxidoreductase
VLASRGVTGAVCGPTRAAQLDPILAARDVVISPADRDRIASFFS